MGRMETGSSTKKMARKKSRTSQQIKSPPSSAVGSRVQQLPFVILIDCRERKPYHFRRIGSGSRGGGKELLVKTEYKQLKTGDYSIKGCEGLVAIERKSLKDLYGTLGQHRDRFEREHERLSEMDFGAVVIEACWERILRSPPRRSKLNPKSVFGTHNAWLQRYRVPWITAHTRRLGEITTLRMLMQWWKDFEEKNSDPSSNCKICGKPLKNHRSWKRGMGPVCASRGDPAFAAKVTEN